MKKNTSRTFILSVLLIAVTILLNSCSGLFGVKLHNDDDRNTAGERILRLSADTSNRNGSRSVWPGQDYNPNITDFTDFKLISDSPISSITSWETYGSFNGSSIILNPTRSYTLRLTAKYKGGEWSSKAHTIPAGSSTANISFVLEPTGTGTFSVSLDVTPVKNQAKTVKFWISDTAAIDRTKNPNAKFTLQPDSTSDPESPVTCTWSDPNRASGKFYALFEILDKNGASTIVGPEAIYVFPGQTSLWETPAIEQLNRKYKITFSREGMEHMNNGNKITANLVPGAVFPEPYVQNIYETTPDLPNYDNELEIQDLFLPPTGYYFYAWWDGKTTVSWDDTIPQTYSAGSPIRGGTFTDDITLSPLWIKNGSIYDYSTKEEIEAYITAESQNDAVETITITFPRGFEDSENCRTAWNTTIAALADSSVNTTNKKVDLQLNYLDRDWLIENVFPDPENPENPTPFTRIAGTKAEPNNWLKSIDPPFMSKIPAYAFYYCTALKSVSSNIDTPSEIGAYAFFNCSSFTQDLTDQDNLITIGKAAFSGSAINSITFAKGLLTIGDSAFENCTALTKITASSLNKLDTIGDYAFKNTGISSITVRPTVTSIGEGAFSNCKNLESVKLSRDIEYIGKDALLNVTTIDTSNLAADSYPWYSYSYSEDEINSTSTSELGICETSDELVSALRGTDGSSPAIRKKYIPTAALSATNLQTLVSGKTSSSTAHFELAFSGEITSASDLSPLQNLTVGTSGATIGLDLSQVTIADDSSTARTIPDEFMNGKEWLSSFKMPQGITTISTGAFTNCTQLDSIILTSDTNSTEPYALAITGDITNWTLLSNLKKINLDSEQGLALDMSECNVGTGTSAKAMADYMFYGSTTPQYETKIGPCLQSIILPDGITSIGISAFSVCEKLQSVSLPSTITSLSSCAFYGCKKLDTVEFRGAINLTSIGGSTFYQCTALSTVSLGDKVQTIGQTAFSGSGLTSITLPSSLTSISDRAFEKCVKLTNITVEGTENWSGTYTWSSIPAHKLQLGITNSELGSLLTESSTSSYNFRRNDEGKDVDYIVSNINGYNKDDDPNFSVTVSGKITDWSIFSKLNSITKDFALDMSSAEDSTENTTIPSELFQENTHLKSFTMPQGTTTIGNKAFAGTGSDLFRLNPTNDALTTIGESAFEGSRFRGILTLGPKVTTIGKRAFQNAEFMFVTFDEEKGSDYTITDIPDWCFFNTAQGSESFYLPASVTMIGRNAFVNCLVGREVSLGDTNSSWNEYFSIKGTTEITTVTKIDNTTLKSSIMLEKVNYEGQATYDSTANDHKIYYADTADTDKTYAWIKASDSDPATASFTYDLNEFSFKESFSSDSGEIGGGTYRIEKTSTEYGTLILYDVSDASESELTEYLKTIILKYSDKAPLRPTSGVNYTLTEGIQEKFNTITEKNDALPSDRDLFRVVTYTIHLGTCGGDDVIFDGTMDDTTGRGTLEYEWDIDMSSGTSDFIIIGWNDSVFPFGAEEFIRSYLSGTSAKAKTSRASLTLPDTFCEGETTVIWN